MEDPLNMDYTLIFNLWFFKNLNYPINKDVGGVHKTPQILGNRIISENFRSLHF